MAARLRVLASTQQLCLPPGPGNRTPVNKRPLCAGRGPRPGLRATGRVPTYVLRCSAEELPLVWANMSKPSRG